MMSAVTAATLAGQRWMDDDHMDGWGWWMMGIGLLIVLALIVALVVFVIRESGHRHGSDNALGTLDHRFARGEIDEDEYRKRRDILRG